MNVKAFVFDMDGTVLHSLPDMALAINEALSQMGLPTRTYDEILNLMGGGSMHLVERAMPTGSSPELRHQTYELWRELYLASDYANTTPFPGMVDAIAQLRERGAKTALLSNKFDTSVRPLTERFFPGLFDLARGEIPPMPRKPDPTSLLQMLNELGVSPQEAAYVGDTNVDLDTARNAGVIAIGVSWGYDKAFPLPQDKLDAYIHDPAELVAIMDELLQVSAQTALLPNETLLN